MNMHTLTRAAWTPFKKILKLDKNFRAEYAQTGHSFVAFVCSCFGALGPSAISYLWVLAMLELRQHEALQNAQGLDPLDDSEQAQFQAICYRSSSARVAGNLLLLWQRPLL
jgi:hypothetical protein